MKRAFAIFSGLFAAVLAGAAAETPTQAISDVARKASDWKDKGLDFIIAHGPSVLGALAIFIVGWMAGSWLRRMVNGKLEKRQLEPPVRILISRVVQLMVLLFTLMIALDTLGFKMATLIAGISVAGVGLGLAMQGMLGNLVAGLVIIFTKPFRVGEYIEIVGVNGQVECIEIFSTVLLHSDRSKVIIPNRKIIGEILHNYGKIRQLDLYVGVSYKTNLADTLAVIRDILKENKRVLKEMAPGVGINMLADSSINISIKPWVTIQDYGAAGPEIYQEIVERFRSRNIELPFPQREIRILNGAHTEPQVRSN